MYIDKYLLRLEENLMLGSGRWIADFTESFRNHRINDAKFDMFIIGNTRPKGFLLSKLFGYFAMPNYRVACFVYCQQIDTKGLTSLIKLISSYMEENNFAWSWLVISKEGHFNSKIKDSIKKVDVEKIGIALVDLYNREIECSPSYLGKRMKAHVKCFK
ncbi:MAG TPA: hypothetical protein EYP60_07385 [bacterium (Candidatus Stahlbacteria)]|nr:hypothetical protein [Candidatus Stahlbacteria bacterium]